MTNPGPVAAGQYIEADWGNAARSRVMMIYPDLTAMNADSIKDEIGSVGVVKDKVYVRTGTGVAGLKPLYSENAPQPGVSLAIYNSLADLNARPGPTPGEGEVASVKGEGLYTYYQGAWRKIDNTPTGAIIAFGGSTPPFGWHLCDGTVHGSTALAAVIGSANAPDLRGKFIRGKGPSVPASGGAENVKIEVNNLPSHNHTITDGAGHHGHALHGGGDHIHGVEVWPTAPKTGTGSEWNINSVATAGGAASGRTSAAGHHGHQLDGAGGHNHTVNNTGGGQPISVLPPFYALTYIIKK